MGSCGLIPEVHCDSIQIGLFVHLGWDIVGLILSVVRIGLKLIDIIHAILFDNIRILRELTTSNLLLSLNLLDADLALINGINVPLDTVRIVELFFSVRGTFNMISFPIHIHNVIAPWYFMQLL